MLSSVRVIPARNRRIITHVGETRKWKHLRTKAMRLYPCWESDHLFHWEIAVYIFKTAQLFIHSVILDHIRFTYECHILMKLSDPQGEIKYVSCFLIIFFNYYSTVLTELSCSSCALASVPLRP